MRMETPLSRVRGLGSARSGAHHWWMERLTSVAAFVLFVWFIASILRLPRLDHDGVVIGVGLSWALFQHTLSGIRHFVMDIGAGYELSANKFWANMTMVGSAVLTALLWIFILGVK